jgi:hypothetical protein
MSINGTLCIVYRHGYNKALIMHTHRNHVVVFSGGNSQDDAVVNFEEYIRNIDYRRNTMFEHVTAFMSYYEDGAHHDVGWKPNQYVIE